MRRDGGKRASVSMNASSTVMGLEALIVEVAAAMEAGSGGWSNRGFPEMRRVVNPGKRVERWFRKAQDEMLLRDRSAERRVVGKWKSGVPLFALSAMVLMLFPRRERCSTFGRAARWRTADSEVISLCSRVSFVRLLGSGHDIVVSRLADAVSDVSAGNRDATAAIYTIMLAVTIQN